MIDWGQVALATNIDRARLQSAKQELQRVFDAVTSVKRHRYVTQTAIETSTGYVPIGVQTLRQLTA